VERAGLSWVVEVEGPGVSFFPSHAQHPFLIFSHLFASAHLHSTPSMLKIRAVYLSVSRDLVWEEQDADSLNSSSFDTPSFSEVIVQVRTVHHTYQASIQLETDDTSFGTSLSRSKQLSDSPPPATSFSRSTPLLSFCPLGSTSASRFPPYSIPMERNSKEGLPPLTSQSQARARDHKLTFVSSSSLGRRDSLSLPKYRPLPSKLPIEIASPLKLLRLLARAHSTPPNSQTPSSPRSRPPESTWGHPRRIRLLFSHRHSRTRRYTREVGDHGGRQVPSLKELDFVCVEIRDGTWCYKLRGGTTRGESGCYKRTPT